MGSMQGYLDFRNFFELRRTYSIVLGQGFGDINTWRCYFLRWMPGVRDKLRWLVSSAV